MNFATLESDIQIVFFYQLQMGELAAEKEKLQEKLRSLTDSNQRTIRSLEARIQALQEDLEVSRSEVKAVQSEYDGYKVQTLF